MLPPPEELESKDTKKVKKTNEKANNSSSQRKPKRKAPQGKGQHKVMEKQQQQLDEPKTEPKPIKTRINEDQKQEEPVEPVIAESFVPPPIRDVREVIGIKRGGREYIIHVIRDTCSSHLHICV